MEGTEKLSVGSTLSVDQWIHPELPAILGLPQLFHSPVELSANLIPVLGRFCNLKYNDSTIVSFRPNLSCKSLTTNE